MQTPVSTIITTGDLGGHKIKMEIDSSALSHIMSILTDLYSDPEGAVIREYSTNALDAHIEAGNSAPIQIFTPNALSPYFIVKDNGVGLSQTDIENMYSKYGSSTKRDSNDQVGMLGLGAKSALTLVPQFSLTSVKDGEKITVSVSRAADGSGQMEIISRLPSEEPNGVEIKIPVPRNHTFMQKVRDFFRFWKPGTVLIDGKDPEFITGRPVGTKFLINRNLNNDYIVMGNVAYPVKESLYEHGSSWSKLGIVAYVSIGDVNFTPSREELHYTPQTKATIKSLQKQFSADLVKSAVDDVALAGSYAEAWQRAREWRTSFYNRLGEFHYKGSKIPTDISFVIDPNSTRSDSIQGREHELHVTRGRRYASWVRSVNPTMIPEYVFVTGFAESLKISPVQRERVRIYMEQNNLNGNKVVLFTQKEIITDPIHLKFLEGIQIVPWSEIAKIKIERVKGANGKVARAEKYDVWTIENRSHEASTFDLSRPIIYVSPAEHRSVSFIAEMIPNAQIAHIGMNRWEKFKRDWPTAERYIDAIETARKALIAQFTEADKILWNYSDHYTRRQFSVLDANRIDDPDLKRFIEIIGTKNLQFSKPAATLRSWPGGFGRTDVSSDETNPLTKYPLASNLMHIDSEHAHWYLNSFYAHLNSKEN